MECSCSSASWKIFHGKLKSTNCSPPTRVYTCGKAGELRGTLRAEESLLKFVVGKEIPRSLGIADRGILPQLIHRKYVAVSFFARSWRARKNPRLPWLRP